MAPPSGRTVQSSDADEPTERRAILAKAVAMTLKPRLAYSTVKNHEFEATVARLKPDFAALIRPRADQLWKRVPKERTLKVAAAVFGEEWAERWKWQAEKGPPWPREKGPPSFCQFVSP